MVSAEVGWQEEHITVSFDVWPDESWLCFEGKTRASWKMILSERQQAECFLQARESGQRPSNIMDLGYERAFKFVRIPELP